MPIAGRCHCGNIAYSLDWPAEAASIPARACGCAFCRKHGNVWTAHAGAALVVTIGDASRVSRYAFETKTADFHVCAICGVVPLVTSTIDGRTYAVVNVNTFEGVDPARLAHASVSFDGESETARLARRSRNWIGDVRFVAN